MIKLIHRPFWQTPIAPAALMLLIGLLARFSAGYGMLLMIVMAMSTLLIMTSSLIALSHYARFIAARTENAISIVLIVASIAVLFTSEALADQTRFMWWTFHHRRALQEATARDGIVPDWPADPDADGRLVMLATDTRDALDTPSGAEDWRARTRWTCRIVDARRMMARVFIVRADHCLGGNASPQK